MGVDNNNGFESINLEPSISIPQINGGSRAPINVPQSLSGTSEDEDQEDQDRDDHEEDPSRFFLSASPKVKSINNTVHNSQSNIMEYEKSKNIPGDEFFLNPLKLSGSRFVDNLPGYNNLQSSYLVNSLNDTITFSLKLDQPTNNESPLEFLTNQNKILTKELMNNVAIHERYLANGHSNLNKVRSMIFQNFEQLSENYYSLNELYSRDLGSTESLFANFEKWDKRRNKVLEKIASIKSPNNKYGMKLGKLLDQSNEVDSEIVEMEKKLESLKVKKQLISVEIETTSSVLESKSAKYVELYRELETQGNEAITNLLVSSGIPYKDIGDFLKTTPVNVTFMENYNIKKAPPPPTQAPPLSNLMGIQPFIPEEMVDIGDNLNNHKYDESLKNDKYDETLQNDKYEDTRPNNKFDELNYGHGASAYEKGYERGVVQSSTVKTHFGNIVHKFLNAKPEKSPIIVKVDDDQNTISEKLDLEPVVEMLDHKINAINDLALSTSKNSTIFREYSMAWKDILGILKSQEDELLEYVSESIPSPDHLDPALVEFLNSTLEQIKSSISSLNRFHQSLNQEFYTQDNSMFEVLINETRAMISALILVSGNSDPNFYLSGFKDLGVPENKLNNLMNYEKDPETIDQTSPILSPRFSYNLHDTYNESASKFQQSTKFQQSSSRLSSPNLSSSNLSSPILSPNQRTLPNVSRKTSPTHNSSFLARTEPNSNKSTYSGKLIGKALKLTKKD
jgi:hypothetical protein